MLKLAGDPLGTTAAARLTAAVSPACVAAGLAAAFGESAKTIVKAPSERSPKCCWSTSRTCSDCVPGTEKVFERIAESFELANPPRTSATIHTARTERRCRITNLVHRAIGQT